MTTLAFQHQRRTLTAGLSPAIWSAIFLIIAAFAIRLPSFGNPAFDIDEEFYLLVGDRMWHGALPYVDIWDRKPVGLFILYAGIRLLGGNGILAYQIVATLFAALTAWIIARIARAQAPEPAATIAGFAYLFWIETVGGGGGQSPVFYNALIAGAAWLTLATLRIQDLNRVWRIGLGAMALAGIAIQIKYTTLFEGAFFGLTLTIRLYALAGWRIALRRSIPLALTGLAPTLAAFAFYAGIGHTHDFLFANFTSIGLRAPSDPIEVRHRLWIEAQHIILFIVCAGASAWHVLRQSDRTERLWVTFVGGWIVAAFVGFGSVGAFFYHYLLPLYVPLCVAAAPIFARRPIGIVLAGITLWAPFSNLDYPDFDTNRQVRAGFERIVAALPADVGTHCLYVHDGPPSLYLLGHACSISRYVFPDHLSSLIEAKAIGVDPVAEVKRILAARPAAITLSLTPLPNRNPAAFTPVLATVRSDYRYAARMWDDGKIVALYVRR